MTIYAVGLILTAATVVAAITFAQRPVQASEAPWCAVTSEGGEAHWECVYNSVEECAPNVLAGNRGFCNPNPRYRSAEQRRNVWRQPSRRRRQGCRPEARSSHKGALL